MSEDAAVWRALADPTRRQLLDQLRDGPRTTGQLAEATPTLTRFAVMKHLTVLQEAGLVVVERTGRERWNHLNAVPLRAAYERWMAPYAERSAESLLRLKAHAEREKPMTRELSVTQELVIDRPREQVFAALCEMGEWFPHRVSHGRPAVLEPKVGGRFYESHGETEGVLFGTVTRLLPPERLMLTGPMGMTGAVVGVITYDLTDEGEATRVRHTHRAFGDIDEDAEAQYTEGWTTVHDAFEEYVRAQAG